MPCEAQRENSKAHSAASIERTLPTPVVHAESSKLGVAQVEPGSEPERYLQEEPNGNATICGSTHAAGAAGTRTARNVSNTCPL